HEFGPACRPEFARRRKHRVWRLSAAHEIVGDVEREARIMPIDPLAERIPGLAPLDGALMRKPVGERHRSRDPTVLAAADCGRNSLYYARAGGRWRGRGGRG